VTSRSLVQRLCTEPNRFPQKQGSLLPAGLLTMNPPRHAPVRAAMNEAFSFAMSHQPAIAQQVVRRAVSDLTRLPHMDLAGGFARRIATENFMQFFGVPQGERAQIDQLARSVMMHADATLDTVQKAIGWRDGAELVLRLGKLLLASYFEALADGGLLPHRVFRGNLLQEMALRTVWLPGMPGSLTIQESVMTALQLTLAGYLSTEFLLATGCRNLLLPQGTRGQRPWDLLVKKAAGLEKVLDEARRFDSPLGVIERVAASDLPAGDFASFAIPKGALLLGFIGSANRDETGWPAGTDLSTFEVGRPQQQHLLTFGDGIHHCIGRPLQAVVVPLAMQALVDEMPNLRLQSPGAVPPWIPNIYFRSFTALPATTCA
jgi:cytochrome P450